MLKNDKNEVFKAASEASKVCDYLHSLENGKVKAADSGEFSHAERLSAETPQRQGWAR